MRRYNQKLLHIMNQQQTIIQENGVKHHIKKIPDDPRQHVLDPRILASIKQKLKRPSTAHFSLVNERFRTDRISIDLCTHPIIQEEILIPVDDHRINLITFKREDMPSNVPCLLYFHGGSMISGRLQDYLQQMRYLADLSQSLVIFVDYRLAPECPYPAGNIDAYQSLVWIYQHASQLNINPDKIILAGDSAGGLLCNYCLLHDKVHMISKVFEIYPVCHVGKSEIFNDDNYFPVISEHQPYVTSRINRLKDSDLMQEQDTLYRQNKIEASAPEVSIIFASDDILKTFPPIVIVSSEYDYLRIGSDYFVKRLQSLHKDVQSIRYSGCDHGFFNTLGFIVQAEDVCLEIAKHLKSA